MDLLFKRYADPFLLLDAMIRNRRFAGFIYEFIGIINQEKKETKEWEFFLHKVYDKSFNEFMEEIDTRENNQMQTRSDIETTVNYSLNMLNHFKPEERG